MQWCRQRHNPPTALPHQCTRHQIKTCAGQLPKAETILREIFETRKKWNGEDSPTTLAIAGNLGNALVNQDKQKEAEVVFRDALERMQRVLGPEHAHSLLTASTTYPPEPNPCGAALLQTTVVSTNATNRMSPRS